MNGNLIAWPKTNQTSAIKPAEIAATIPRSEILLRISQTWIAQRRAPLIKIDIFHDLVGELAHTLGVRLFRGAARDVDRVFELAGLRVSGGESSNENRVRVLRDLVGLARELHRDFVISKRIIRTSRYDP